MTALIDTNLVLQALDGIAWIKTRKGKLEALRDAMQSQLFCKVLVAALDPFVTYGIAKLPEVTKRTISASEKAGFDEKTWQLLQDLSQRKLTGNRALYFVTEELKMLPPQSCVLFGRILTKDLRAGISDKTVNAVVPGMIPVYECMLAQPYKQGRIDSLAKKANVQAWPAMVQMKYDGIRAQCIIDMVSREFTPLSRNGLPLTSLSHLQEAAFELGELAHKWRPSPSGKYVIDCEGVEGDGASFNASASAIKKQSKQALGVSLKVFEVLHWEEFMHGSPLPLSERHEFASNLIQAACQPLIHYAESWEVNSHEEIMERANEVMERGCEGVIVKPYYGTYEPRRSMFWQKIKLVETYDLLVTGVEEGQGQFADSLGAFVCDYFGVEVRVGGGLSVEQRQDYWQRWLSDPNSITNMIVEVKGNGVTEDGSIRHPQFVRERFDKRIEDSESSQA